jgi:hypothetical protein
VRVGEPGSELIVGPTESSHEVKTSRPKIVNNEIIDFFMMFIL